MVSQRKRLANRMNSRKSTGPRTARGKGIVSRNAVTHGLTVRAGPVLAGESELDYEAFADAMRRDLRPMGVLQRELVEHMTQICWKLRRIPSIEAVLLDYQMHCIERGFGLSLISNYRARRLGKIAVIKKDVPVCRATA